MGNSDLKLYNVKKQEMCALHKEFFCSNSKKCKEASKQVYREI